MRVKYEKLLEQKVENNYILEDQYSDNILLLDEMSGVVWEIIKKSGWVIDINDIAEEIALEYDVDKIVVYNDIKELVGQLEELGYVE